MLDFRINTELCTLCGECVSDCPAMIIEMGAESPVIRPEKEPKCYLCQHCLAICPEGAVSILGKIPEESLPADLVAGPLQMEALIRNRRTVRRFKPMDVPGQKIEKMIQAAANAPTGKNAREVRLTLIDRREIMDAFKERIIQRIEEAENAGELTGENTSHGTRARLYRRGKDFIFRDAPHLILATAPASSPTPLADGFIALSYMELMAFPLKVGVIWAGFVTRLLEQFPELLLELGVPGDHILSYVLLFGESDLDYPRGVQRDDIQVHRPVLPGVSVTA